MDLKKKLSTVAISSLIGIVALVVGEMGLRLSNLVPEDELVREVRYDNFDWYQINRGYLKKYFSPASPLIPELKESLFRKEKMKATFRVFCLGGSSMFGVPYQMNANIPGILRKHLRNAYPEMDIEVVNWGASAINSNAILDLSYELVQFNPDLICIYMGHNEFYGPEGVGANVFERLIPSLIPLKYKLRDLRLLRLFASLLPVSSDDQAEGQNLMKQVSMDVKVRSDSDDEKWVLENFERNLKALLQFWSKHNIPVVVGDVSSNLMFPPFAYDEIPAGVTDSVSTSYQAGNFERVLAILEPLHRQDSTIAYVEYWMGRAMLSMKRWGAAKPFLVRSRDHDLLKFRAPSRINSIIHNVCAGQSVPCVRVDSLFASLSENDIPGDALFWEHLHPNVAGYYAIGRSFFHRVVAEKFTPDLGQAKPVEYIPYDLNRLSICWLDLAYGDLSIRRLTGRWPFENYNRRTVTFDSADARLQSIAIATYTRTLVWDEACYQTAEYFWRQGKITEARTTYEAILEEYPYNYYAHYLLGNLIAKSGNVEEALHHYNLSVQSSRDYPNPRLDAGLLLINSGEFDAAIRILGQALPLTTGEQKKAMRANVFYGLAAAYANKEDYNEALINLDKALELHPTYPDAIRLREAIVVQRGK